MQSADQSAAKDGRPKVATAKGKLQLSDSPAFRKANRDALASIKKIVSRLKANCAQPGSDSKCSKGPEGVIDWQQKCRWQRPWPGETGVEGWLTNKEVPVIHVTNSFTITGATDPKIAASSAASQLDDNRLFFSKAGKSRYPKTRP